MKRFFKFSLILVFWINALILNAQTLPENVCVIENGELKFHINLNWSVDQFAELRSVYALDSIMIEELVTGKREFEINGERWIARSSEDNWVVLQKPVKKQSNLPGLFPNLFLKILTGPVRQDGMPGYVSGPVKFGFNVFRRVSITQDSNNVVTFNLYGFKDAKSVLLSGSFNQWATSGHNLIPTESGWKISLNLVPGKYYYKFIVDGRWISDPENYQYEPDGHGGKNSIMFVTNHEFYLTEYKDAASVVVAGSFNSWNQQQCKMSQTQNGWKLPVYLSNGKHQYKFIVDGQWILDPNNPMVAENEFGTGNSLLTIGKPFVFFIPNHHEAKKVALAGNFNAWSKDADLMNHTDSGWIINYFVSPGNYEYKYVVDDVWMIDSLNPITLGTGEYMNSFISIEPNHRFEVQGFTDAKSVIITGNFNGWIHHGYQMQKGEDGWYLDIYLNKGKTIYRLIVDGVWMQDPNNPSTEPNEYDGLNSIMWVE